MLWVYFTQVRFDSTLLAFATPTRTCNIPAIPPFRGVAPLFLSPPPPPPLLGLWDSETLGLWDSGTPGHSGILGVWDSGILGFGNQTKTKKNIEKLLFFLVFLRGLSV